MKTLKTTLIAAAVGFMALSGAVLSQVITLPQVSVLNPTDLIQVIVRGQPTAQSLYAPPSLISNTYGYYKSAASSPPSGFSYTFTQGVTYASFTPSGTITYGYVVVNQAPSDGTRNCVFSTGTITNFSVCSAYNTTTGACTQTGINASVTTLSANATACYLYSAGNQTWDRSQ